MLMSLHFADQLKRDDQSSEWGETDKVCCHFDVPTMSPSLFRDNGVPAPFLHSAKSSDPDLLTCKQAMNDADHAKWVLAMQKEIAELEGKDTWVKVPKSEAMTNILPSLWLFKLSIPRMATFENLKLDSASRGNVNKESLTLMLLSLPGVRSDFSWC